MMRALLLGLVAFACACASSSTRYSDVFQRPQVYGEFETRVCGYVRAAPGDTSIWIDRASWELRDDAEWRQRGMLDHVVLGLVAQEPGRLARHHDRQACFRGEVIACAGEDSECAGSGYPYAFLVYR